MESEIIKMAVSQGLWAVLFVALLFYVLKENAKREDRLLKCLEKLNLLDGICEDVKETREDVQEIKGVVTLGRIGHG